MCENVKGEKKGEKVQNGNHKTMMPSITDKHTSTR